jgi:hypothetical protein
MSGAQMATTTALPISSNSMTLLRTAAAMTVCTPGNQDRQHVIKAEKIVLCSYKGAPVCCCCYIDQAGRSWMPHCSNTNSTSSVKVPGIHSACCCTCLASI